MTGFFKPSFKQLSQKQRKLYKTLYCSICRTISQQYSRYMTLFLPSDLIFLILCSIETTPVLDLEEADSCRCSIIPLHQIHSLAIWHQPLLQKFADLSVWIISVLFLDKFVDESTRTAASNCYKFFWAPMFRKNRLRMRALDPDFDPNMLHLLKLLRTEKCHFGKPHQMIGPVCRWLASYLHRFLTSSSSDNGLWKLCYNTIETLYFLDALKDFRQDQKKGRLNILNGTGEPVEACALALNSIYACISNSLVLTQYRRHQELIHHILHVVCEETAPDVAIRFYKEVNP